jgi:YVTN family beta-propeller protein
MLSEAVKVAKFSVRVIVLITLTILVTSSLMGLTGTQTSDGQHINFSPPAHLNLNTNLQAVGDSQTSLPHSSAIGFNGLKEIESLLALRQYGYFNEKQNSSPASVSVTFEVTNKGTGITWSVYIFTNLSSSVPDLPLYNTLTNEDYGVIFSGASSSSTITTSLIPGTYYYYTGPSGTMIGPYKFKVASTETVSITFPSMVMASFTEQGLTSGGIWNVYATTSLASGKLAILSQSASSSTITAYLPNGYYSFAFGIGALVIESSPLLVYGKNVTRQIFIPPLHSIIFKESGLSAGTAWGVYGVTLTSNQYLLENFFTVNSDNSTITINVPDGVYLYQPTTEGTLFSESSPIYVNGENEMISVVFPSLNNVTFEGFGYRSGIGWQMSVFSTNAKYSSSSSTLSSSMTFSLPSGSYTFTGGEGGAYFISGSFNVSSSVYSQTISFPQTYVVNISESGLNDTMSWGIAIFGSGRTDVYSNTSLNSSLSIYLPVGKYNYTYSENTMGTIINQQYQDIYSSATFSVGANGAQISLKFPKLTEVKFTETNLPSGIDWGVSAFSTTSSSGFREEFFNTSSPYQSVNLYLINGSYYYSIYEAGTYIYPSGNTINVSGQQLTESYVFPSLYPVTFSIIGLTSNTTWTLTIENSNFSYEYTNSSFNAVMTAYLPNSSYNYSATTSSQLSTSSSFVVKGSTLKVTVIIQISYPITFEETGLPNGTLWYVSLNGVYSFSSNSTIITNEPNGTYVYNIVASSYTAVPANGTIVVSGRSVIIPVSFRETVITYPITFSESGLSNGTVWSITISNSTISSIFDSITIREPNGTFTYEVNASGYSPNPSAGLIFINGSGQSVSISFTPTLPVTKYTISFNESGLSPGTQWTVSLTNSTYSGKIVGTISTSSKDIAVYGITYDGANKYLYASGIIENSTSLVRYPGVVLVISPPTNTIISIISVGSLPESSVYDPYNGYLYTANALTNNVSVINTATNAVISTIQVGNQPVGITYSSLSQDIYVSNAASGTVSIISSTTNTVINSISLGPNGEKLAGEVYDPSNGNIYVGGFNNGTAQDSVFVINSKTNGIVTTIPGGAYFGAYDSLNGYLYFTDHALNSVLVVNGNNNQVVTTIDLPALSSPLGIAYDSFDHNIYVSEQNSSILAVISSLSNTVISNIAVTGSPLFPTYYPSNHDIYLSNHLVGGIQIITSFGGLSSIQSSTNSSIKFSEPNGTYSYTIGYINGYSLPAESGTLKVEGSGITQTIKFSPVSGYSVTFAETGLRNGRTWSVTFGASTINSTNPTISFRVINGSYSFHISNVSGYLLSPTTGVIKVNGSSITKTVTFMQLFSVKFIESNLTSGATWSVTLGNSTVTSTGSTISFTETNGSYSFSISTSSNLTFSPTSGTITVAGNNVTQSVEFSATPPPSIKLYLTGSISPTNATLLVNGKEVPTTNGIFNISIVPGAYEIEVTMTGYQPYYKNMTILSNQTQTTHLSITLEKIYRPTSFPLIYLIIIAVVIVAIIGGVSTLILRKGRKVAEKKGE